MGFPIKRVIFYSYVSLPESKDVGFAFPVLHSAEPRGPSMVGSRPPFSVQTCESHSPISSGYALGAPQCEKNQQTMRYEYCLGDVSGYHRI